jgi:signal transduction histidine kinase
MIVKMSAQVAHEIRNPLGTLTLNIDLLEDEISSYSKIDTAEAKKLVSIVKSETENLHKVLKEYLECTRFPTIKPEKHYINSILREMFTALEEDFRQRQVQSKTSLEYNLPPANVDQDQLKRAFLNIILNALDEMKSGGIIEISTCTVDKWIEITFTDTGAGISNENKDKIFTPFYTTKSSGTGLGLSITKHIITEHQGEILCQNVPEKGASFIVRLPVMEEEV